MKRTYRPALTAVLIGTLALASLPALATTPTTQTTWGLGSDGSTQWEQLRFYAPAGGKTAQYPQGQPTYYGTTTKDYCWGSDICGTTLNFKTKTVGTVKVTASDDNIPTPDPKTTGFVYQDLDLHYGGLGVGSLVDGFFGPTVSPFNPDEINNGDLLTFSFEQDVQIIGLHLFSADHQTFPTSWSSGSGGSSSGGGVVPVTTPTAQTFSILTNDKLFTYTLNSGIWFGPSSPLIGRNFTFVSNGTGFYVGALKVRPAIPEPSTYALIGLGLVSAAWVARRRRT